MNLCKYCHKHEAQTNKGVNAGLCRVCLQKMLLIQDMSNKGLKNFSNRHMAMFLEANPQYKKFYRLLTEDELSTRV